MSRKPIEEASYSIVVMKIKWLFIIDIYYWYYYYSSIKSVFIVILMHFLSMKPISIGRIDIIDTIQYYCYYY